MKTKSILYFLFFITASPMYGQWMDISVSTPHTFTSVSFLNDQVGFVAGGREIYKTINGGHEWALVLSADTLVHLEEILIINQSTVIAAGYDFIDNKSVILRSTDLGLSWISIENDYSTLLRSLYFINDSIGYAVGSANYIFRTNDSGLTWERMSSPVTNTFFESVFFSDALNGHVVGGLPGHSNYVRTTDGGNHWEEIIIDSDNYLQSVFFLDAFHGYIVGWNGEILVTDDGGDSWLAQTSVNMAGNLQIVFTNDSTGYIVGGMSNEGVIQKTTNYGNLWIEIGSEIAKGLVAIDFPSENIGYVAGSTGTILKTVNGGVTRISGFENVNKLLIYPNPVHDQLFIQSNELITNVRLSDNSGIIIESVTVSAYDFNLNMDNLPPGNYYLIVRAGAASGVYRIVRI